MRGTMEAKGVILEDAGIAEKEILHNEMDWIRQHGKVIERLYREIKKGERVKVIIHPNPKYFITNPIYDVITEDGYQKKVDANFIELL